MCARACMHACLCIERDTRNQQIKAWDEWRDREGKGGVHIGTECEICDREKRNTENIQNREKAR